MFLDCLFNIRRSATEHRHDELQWLKEQVARLDQRVTLLEAQNIARKLNHLSEGQRKIMATLDDLVAAASAEDTKIDSLIALVEALKAKVDAIPGLTPEQQAAIDTAFASISDNPDRIQAALDANTPAAP